MADESTTPDLVALTRLRYEIVDRSLNFDAIAAFYLPDAVMDLSHVGLGTYEGVDAVGAVLTDYWRTWEEHHHYVEEILDLGNGVVFASLREDGRLKGSNSFVEGHTAWITEWVEGKIARNTSYPAADEARAAAECLAEERGRRCRRRTWRL
jgi:ketosteroid isomerase-like protein